MITDFLKDKFSNSPSEEVDRSGIILGIDPGAHGAFALIQSAGILEVCDMPVVNGDVDCLKARGIFEEWKKRYKIPYVAIEQVPPSVGMEGNSASQFKLGKAYGKILAVAELAFDGDPNFQCTMLLSPRKWQNILRLTQYKESVEWVKGKIINPHKCQGPRGGWLDGRTDAVCIAYAAYELLSG